MIPTSASFEAQRTAASNLVRDRVLVLFGDYGLTALGTSWSSKAMDDPPSPPTVDPSVFDSPLYGATDLGDGIRHHLNFGDRELAGIGRGWRGGQRTTGAGLYEGVVIRNLDTPDDGPKDNIGRFLAQRFRAPDPGGGVLAVGFKQLACRMAMIGAPAGTFVRVQGDAAGLPDGVNLGSFEVDADQFQDGWMTSFAFAAFTLTPGADYWLVLDDNGGTLSDHWEWESITSPPDVVNEYAAEDAGGGFVAQTYALHYRTTFGWAGSPQQERITVGLGVARTVNRIRLYGYPSSRTTTHLSPLKYRLYWGLAGTYTAVTVSSIRGTDYGNDNETVSVAGNLVIANDATYLDILTTTVTADSLRIEIIQTQSGLDWARLQAVEVYDEVEVSDRIVGYDTDRRRDAIRRFHETATATLEASNVDRFWSPRYSPTPLQTSFHNSEQAADLELQIEQGFQTDEKVRIGTYYLDDSPNVNPRPRDASLQARDWSKHFESALSEAGRFYRRVEDLVEVAVNRSNWSSSRMVLAQTESFVPFWGPNGTTIRDEVQRLSEAAPLAAAYFDELGTFRFVTFEPSTSFKGPLRVGSQQYTLGTVATGAYRANLIERGDRCFIAVSRWPSRDPSVIEYNVATRAVTELFTIPGGGTITDQVCCNMVADGNFLYLAEDQTLYKVDLTTGSVVATLVLTGLLGGLFSQVSQKCARGVVVGGFWYFSYVAGGVGERLAKVATSLAAGTEADLGQIEAGVFVVDTTRLVRWNPSGATDRIYFATESGTQANSYWNLLTAAMAFDLTRRGVSAAGPLLYEMTTARQLQSRTEAGATAAIGTPQLAPGLGQVGIGIGYAAGRIWSSHRVGSSADEKTNQLQAWNPVDGSQYDLGLPEAFQKSMVAEELATGRALVVESMQFDGGSPQIEPTIRVVQGPNAQTQAAMTFSWSGELLDARYRRAGQNAGVNAIVTGIRWMYSPIVFGQPQMVWQMTNDGRPLGPIAPVFFPGPTGQETIVIRSGTTLDLLRSAAAKRGDVSLAAFYDTLTNTLAVEASATGYPCPNAPDPVVFGPAVTRSLPPGYDVGSADWLAAPQQVVWGQIAGQPSTATLRATLYPHPTSPRLILEATGATDVILNKLQIFSTPMLRGGMQMTEVLASDVLTDGTTLRQQHGDNFMTFQNDYLGDSTLLLMACIETMRLLAHQQDQLDGVRVRPSPPLQIEDVVRVTEPESGVDFDFVCIGVAHSRRGSDSQAVAETRPTLLAMPVSSTTGIGQSPSPSSTRINPTAA